MSFLGRKVFVYIGHIVLNIQVVHQLKIAYQTKHKI